MPFIPVLPAGGGLAANISSHRPDPGAPVAAGSEPATGLGDPPAPSPQVSRRLELARVTRERFEAAAAADPDRRQALLDQVVQDHLWLAETLSRRFRFRGEEEEDLLQVARIGLVEASQRFDLTHGSFLAFAVPTVSGVLKRHFRDHGWMVRPPRQTQELAASIWQQWSAVAQHAGTIPSERQLAASLGASVDAVRQARFASQGYTGNSLDTALLHGPAHTGADLRAGEEETERCEARLVIGQVWSRLTPAEQDLLRMRFYDQRSQSEIAAEIGTSQMQVSRLLSRLLTKLRGLVGALDLPPAARRAA